MNTIYLQYILYIVISYRLFNSLAAARLIYNLYTVSQYIQQDINFSCMFKGNVTIKAVY